MAQVDELLMPGSVGVRTRKTISKQLQLRLLGTVVEFMARAGASEAAIRDSFEKCVTKSLEVRSGSGGNYQDGAYRQNGDLSADLLRLWHRDGRLIGVDDAKPRPLHQVKGRNSVRSLILSLDKNADVSGVISFMKSSRLIRKTRDGRYLPTEEVGTITQDDTFVVEHLVKSVIRLFSTMRRNTSVGGLAQPLIERYAYVSDLNPQDRKEFAEFTRSQGLSYLQAVDDWMEQRRLGKVGARKVAKKKGVVAGVQIVAYLGDNLGAGDGEEFGSLSGRVSHGRRSRAARN